MSFQVVEVSDGGFDYSREMLLPQDADAESTAHYPPVVPVPYRPLLLRSDTHCVLLDTGAGPMAPSTGQLGASLAAAGIRPEMVDLVVLSHAHADHIGGLLLESGRAAFPKARIVIGRKEYDFWRHSGIRERLGSGAVYNNAAIEGLIATWVDKYLFALSDRLDFMDPGDELIPGLTSVPAPGHTPGQMALLVETADGPLLYTGDAFTLPEHVTYPEWTSGFDLDTAQTVATRRVLLDRAATDRCRVVHYHVGGIGRIIRRGSTYVWEPEDVMAPENAVHAN